MDRMRGFGRLRPGTHEVAITRRSETMMETASKAVAVVIGLVLSALVVIAVGPALAQTPIAPSIGGGQPTELQVPPPAMTGDAKRVEGKIQAVREDTVTLADGTQLTIPANQSRQREDLKPGASVKASFVEKGGQKVVTSIQVEPKGYGCC
jgi:hypothetical protein